MALAQLTAALAQPFSPSSSRPICIFNYHCLSPLLCPTYCLVLLPSLADVADRLDSLPNGQDTPLRRRMVHRKDHMKNPYQPLDKESLEIRLLTVYPATNPSEVPVKCSLSHANLSQEPKPEYETISYTWGESTERKTIIVDNFRLEVPVSAERAIRRMRLRDRSRVLWIDAICVNQADTNEKNHQVRM